MKINAFAAAALFAVVTTFHASEAEAAMEAPCPVDTTVESIDFMKPPDDTACVLCSKIMEECSVSCSYDGKNTTCTVTPEGCGDIVCPEPYVPPTRPDGCPETKPEWEDPCDFDGDCYYPETHDPYCFFSCMDFGDGTKKVAEACMGGGMEVPPEEPEILPVVLPECSALATCLDCLNQEGCDAWSVGQCFSTCKSAPMDVSCWSQKYVSGTPEEICQKVEDEKADDKLCSAQQDCESCKNATTSDGKNKCQWFDDIQYCDNGCGMMGCGVDTCSGEPPLGGVGMANPASVYCEENGGTLEIRTEEAGEYGVCMFEDGSECEEFTFMRGECSPGDSIQFSAAESFSDDTSSASNIGVVLVSVLCVLATSIAVVVMA